jgi:hypothetical protein
MSGLFQVFFCPRLRAITLVFRHSYFDRLASRLATGTNCAFVMTREILASVQPDFSETFSGQKHSVYGDVQSAEVQRYKFHVHVKISVVMH